MKKFRPGVSFGDFVIQDVATRKSKLKETEGRDYRRGWLVWMVIVLGFGLLVVRLGVLQVFQGGKFRVLADENRVKQIKIMAPRGEIVDRNGEVVAKINWVKKDVLGLSVDYWEREYVFGEILAPVLGYLSEVGEDEVGLLKHAGQKYVAGDLVGRSGFEEYYEKELHGADGGILVEVDNAGKVVRELGIKAPSQGQQMKITIDAKLSEVGYKALKGKKGVVIASVPLTGEVLSLVSSPSYDPNLFSQTSKRKENASKISQVLLDKELPLFNRAIGGVYPPGSTFKMVSTAAAIDSGRVKPDFVFEDKGIMTVGKFSYTNWLFTKRGGVEGVVGFVQALKRSTDTFFYKTAELTTPEVIADFAYQYGYGKKTGIDLYGEVDGLVATPEWKKRVIGEAWFLGNTYHMGIGQGDLLSTPLQVNLMTSTIATGGKKCRPHLNSKKGVFCEEVQISEDVKRINKEGMVAACSTDGTAFPLFDWNDAAKQGLSKAIYTERFTGQSLPVVACKTGTAEFMAENGKMKTHAWLTVYAPVDDPQIAVTVLLEAGGEGSNAAAPVARQVLAKYFDVLDTYPYSNIPQVIAE